MRCEDRPRLIRRRPVCSTPLLLLILVILLSLVVKAKAFEEWSQACPSSATGIPLRCDDGTTSTNAAMKLSCELLIEDFQMNPGDIENVMATARIISIIDVAKNFTVCVQGATLFGKLLEVIETVIDIGLEEEIMARVPSSFLSSFVEKSVARMAAVRHDTRWALVLETDEPVGYTEIAALNNLRLDLAKMVVYTWQDLPLGQENYVRQLTGHGSVAGTDVVLVFQHDKPLYAWSASYQSSATTLDTIQDDLGVQLLSSNSYMPFPLDVNLGIASLSLHLWVPIVEDDESHSIFMMQGILGAVSVQFIVTQGEAAISIELPDIDSIFSNTLGDIGNALDPILNAGAGLSNSLAVYISDKEVLAQTRLLKTLLLSPRQYNVLSTSLLESRISKSIEQALSELSPTGSDFVVTCIPFSSPTSCVQSDVICRSLFSLLQSVPGLDLCGAFAPGNTRLVLSGALGQSILLGPNNSLRFNDPTVFISYDTNEGLDGASFGFSTSTEIAVNGGQKLKLLGSLVMGSTSFSAFLALIGEWQEPFGFEFISVQDLFLRGEVTYDLSGFTPSYGGSLTIGQENALSPPSGTACMGLDPNVPNRNWFFFRISSIGLTDLFALFREIGSLGTAPQIPLPSIFDKAVSFQSVQAAWIPPKISGFTSGSPPICILNGQIVQLRSIFAEGFTFYGDIIVLGWNLVAEIELELAEGGRPRKAFFGMNSANAIRIGPGLINLRQCLSGCPDRNAGPAMTVRVDFEDAIPAAETIVNGAMEIPEFSVTASVQARITGQTTFDAELRAQVKNLFTADVRVVVRGLNEALPRATIRVDVVVGDPFLRNLGESAKEVLETVDNGVKAAVKPIQVELENAREALHRASQAVANAFKSKEHWLGLKDKALREVNRIGEELDNLREALGNLCPPKRDCPTICDAVDVVCEWVGKILGHIGRKVCKEICRVEIPDPICVTAQLICYGPQRRQRRKMMTRAPRFGRVGRQRPRSLNDELQSTKEEYDRRFGDYQDAQATANKYSERFDREVANFNEEYDSMVKRIQPLNDAKGELRKFQESLPGKALDFLADRKRLRVGIQNLAMEMPVSSSEANPYGRYESQTDFEAVGLRGNLDPQIDLEDYQGSMSGALDKLTVGRFGGDQFSDSTDDARQQREDYERNRKPPTSQQQSIGIDGFDRIDFDIPPPIPLQSDRRLPDVAELSCIDTDGVIGVFPSYSLRMDVLILPHVSSEAGEYGTIWTMDNAYGSDDGTAVRLWTSRAEDYQNFLVVIEFATSDQQILLSTELLEPKRWYDLLALVDQNGASLWVDSEPIASVSKEKFPWFAGKDGQLCWKPCNSDDLGPGRSCPSNSDNFLVGQAEPTRNVGIVASLDVKAVNPNAAQLSPFVSSLIPQPVLNAGSTTEGKVLIKGSRFLSSTSTLSLWLRLDYDTSYTSTYVLFRDRRTSHLLEVEPSSGLVLYRNGDLTLTKKISLRGWHLVSITQRGDNFALYVNGFLYDSGRNVGRAEQSIPKYEDSTDSSFQFDLLAGQALRLPVVQMSGLNFRNAPLEPSQMVPSHGLEWWPSQRPVSLPAPTRPRVGTFFETKEYEYLLVSSAGVASGYTWGQAQDECKRRFSTGSDLAWSLSGEALGLREDWLNQVSGGAIWIGLRRLDVGWTFVDGSGASEPDTVDGGESYCTVLRWALSEGGDGIQTPELAGLDCYERRSHFLCQRNPRQLLARRENLPSSDAFTWSFFVKMSRTTTTDSVIWSTKDRGHRVVLEGNSTRVRWSLDPSSEQQDTRSLLYSITTPDIPLGTFVHLVFVIRVTRLELYLDGQLVKYEESKNGVQPIEISDDLVFGNAPLFVRHIKYWPKDLWLAEIRHLVVSSVNLVDSHLIHEPYRGPVSTASVRVAPSQTRVLLFWARHSFSDLSWATTNRAETVELTQVPFLQQGDDPNWHRDAPLAMTLALPSLAGEPNPTLLVYLGNGLSLACPPFPRKSMSESLATLVHLYVSPGHSAYMYYNNELQCSLEHPLVVGLDERPLHYNDFISPLSSAGRVLTYPPPPVLWGIQMRGQPSSLVALTEPTLVFDRIHGSRSFRSSNLRPLVQTYLRLPRFPGTLSFEILVGQNLATSGNDFTMDWNVPAGDISFLFLVHTRGLGHAPRNGTGRLVPRYCMTDPFMICGGYDSDNAVIAGTPDPFPLLDLKFGTRYLIHLVVGYDYVLVLRDGEVAFSSILAEDVPFRLSNSGRSQEYGLSVLQHVAFAGVSISDVNYHGVPLCQDNGIYNLPVAQALFTTELVRDPVYLDAVVTYAGWHTFDSERYALSWWQKALETQAALEFPLKPGCFKDDYPTFLLLSGEPDSWHFVRVIKEAHGSMTVTVDGVLAALPDEVLSAECHVVDASLENSVVAFLQLLKPPSAPVPSLTSLLSLEQEGEPTSPCSSLSSNDYITITARLPTSSYRLSMTVTLKPHGSDDAPRGFVTRPLLCRTELPTSGLTLFSLEESNLLYPHILWKQSSDHSEQLQVLLSDSVGLSMNLPKPSFSSSYPLEVVVGAGAAELWWEGALVNRTKFTFQGPFPTSLLSTACELGMVPDGSYFLLSKQFLVSGEEEYSCLGSAGANASSLESWAGDGNNCMELQRKNELNVLQSVGTLMHASNHFTATSTDMVLGGTDIQNRSIDNSVRWSIVVVGYEQNESFNNDTRAIVQNVETGECMIASNGRIRMTRCSPNVEAQIFLFRNVNIISSSTNRIRTSASLSNVEYCPFGQITTVPDIRTVSIDPMPTPGPEPDTTSVPSADPAVKDSVKPDEIPARYPPTVLVQQSGAATHLPRTNFESPLALSYWLFFGSIVGVIICQLQ